MSRERSGRAGRVGVTVACLVAALGLGMLATGPTAAVTPGASDVAATARVPARTEALAPVRQPARSIKVTITGLPAGTAARVTVRGPSGFRENLTGTTLMARLVRGRYSVTALPVTLADGSIATATVSADQVRVTRRTRARVLVTYSVTPGPTPTPDPTPTGDPTPTPTPTPDPTTTTPSPSPTASTPTGWTGTWCYFGSDFGRIVLTQDGSNVTGTFTGTDETYHKRGRITATSTGTTITGRWDRDASVSNLPGQDAGTLTWNLGADHLTMYGTYTRDDYPNDQRGFTAERAYGPVSCTGPPYDR